jgi:hypothetical protein
LIGEALAVVALVATGESYVRTAGVKRHSIAAALAFPTGVACVVLLGLVLLALRIPAKPLTALLVATLSAALASIRWLKRSPSEWLMLGLVCAIGLVGTVALRIAHLINLSPDSFDTAWSGSLLGMYGNTSFHQAATLERRSLALPYLHGLAGNLSDGYFLPSISPLLAISCLALILIGSWTLMRTQGSLTRASAAWFVGLLAVLTLTTNRFVYHAFYLHSHMWFATALATIVVSGVLVLRGSMSERALRFVAVPTIAVAVVLRPEGAIVISLVILPLLVGRWDYLDVRTRSVLLAALGMSTLLWNGAILWPAFGSDVTVAVVGSTALGLALTALAFASDWLKRLNRRFVLGGCLTALFVMVGAAAIFKPDTVRASVDATIQNQLMGSGLWGRSLILLCSLLILGFLLIRSKVLSVTVFGVIAFAPVSLLLAVLRDGAYRVGSGDSLNRMLFHFVPLMVLALAGFIAGKPRWGTESESDRGLVRDRLEDA